MKKNRKKIIVALLEDTTELSHSVIRDVVTKTLAETTQEQSAHIQELLVEKERLEQDIKTATLKLQELRQDSFTDIETVFNEMFTEIEPQFIKTLTELQLESIDILDILAEVTESAFIAAIENGENIEAAFREITRDLTHKTLRDGYLTLDRAKHVIEVIISVAVTFAEAKPNASEAILKGAIYGTKKGLTQAIKIFKDQFAYIPDQLAPRQIKSLQQTFEDLHHTDTLFIQAIKRKADSSESVVKDQMHVIIERMHPELSELINISKETLILVSEKLTKLGKQAVIKGEKVLHSKAAAEAKRMGVTVWDVAKGALGGAISSAKDAIDQKKQSKK